MSTHSFIAGMREGCRGIALPALSILVGAVVALQLLLPSVAFAHSTTNLTSGSPAALTPGGLRDLTGVSVVRVVMTYGKTSSSARTSQVQCTDLGVLVGSWPSSPAPSTPYRNWVLTDGVVLASNVNDNCSPGTTNSLLNIQILASDEYTNITRTFSIIATLDCSSGNTLSSCKDLGGAETFTRSTNTGGNAPVGTLFSFVTHDPQPYLTLDLQATTDKDASGGIGLVNKDTQKPPSLQLAGTPVVNGTATPVPGTTLEAENFLMPLLNPSNSTDVASGAPPQPAGTMFEVGTPLVSSTGQLVALKLSNGELSPVDIKNLLQKETDFQPGGPASRQPAPNLLNNGWNLAMNAFDARQYLPAHVAFQPILNLNPSFQAAKTFDAQAVQLGHISSTKSRPSTGNNNGQGTGFNSMLLIIGLVAAFVFVVLLLVLVTIFTGRSRARRRELARFAEEQKEAQRIAEREVQRQHDAHQAQRAKSTAHLQAVAREIRCPNCNQSVQVTDTICPYCRYPLSPSASGLSMRLAGNAPVASAPMNNVHVPPAPPMQSALPSISDMPTAAISPVNNQPPLPQPAASHSLDLEKTIPYNVQQVRGRNLSLAVGTRSDPGIKRKHKPNEDSLFALQGARTHDSSPQQFGLFVVADGMGGHASGQEASRLAIQTMIDFMLPKIAESVPMDDKLFQRLLGDGVQHANQAVHQRNMEAHADMGTTMTAALVVSSTAYVANVGDSRTYLYREPQGLTKVTNDHSVVASLVEAGIIKPDDIYTHPKRNQIYRSLGEKPVVEVDTFAVPLQPGDKLLLCSDGLWDMVRDPEIQRVMSTPAPNPNKTGQELVKAALNGGGEDNVSVIVVEIAEANERTSITGIQLLEKPETVTVPDLPSI